jgi:hypothetical protein
MKLCLKIEILISSLVVIFNCTVGAGVAGDQAAKDQAEKNAAKPMCDLLLVSSLLGVSGSDLGTFLLQATQATADDRNNDTCAALYALNPLGDISLPTITSISPTGVRKGDTLTITGTGFSPILSKNIVRLLVPDYCKNQYDWNISECTSPTAATVVSATSTELKVTIPTLSSTTSSSSSNSYKRVLVRTNFGTAVSESDLTYLGDYKYFFITSTTYTGNLGGLSGANLKCNSDSGRPNTSVTYKAWLYISSSNYQSPSASDYRSGGALQEQIIFTGTGNINNPSNFRNGYFSSLSIWTGRDLTNHCSSWASTAGNGNYGDSASSSNYLNFNTATCASSYKLYCFEP